MNCLVLERSRKLEEWREQVHSGALLPQIIKARLAMEIVERFHDAQQAQLAWEDYEKISKGSLPENLPILELMNIPSIGLIGLLSSAD